MIIRECVQFTSYSSGVKGETTPTEAPLAWHLQKWRM